MSEQRLDLRASDADRQAVADRVRAAGADGRLDLTEVEQRLEAAYGARTYGELAPLTADLGPAPTQPPPRPGTWQRHWRDWAFLAVILNAIWAITSIAAGELLFYWPIFPLGIWGAVNLATMLFGEDDSDDDGRHRLHRPPPPPRLP